MTDLLYELKHTVEYGKDHKKVFAKICKRYIEIRDALGLSIKIEDYLSQVEQDILEGESSDYTASRGEYLNGLLLADYLGFEFIDAADVIKFDRRGKYCLLYTSTCV